MSKRNDFLIIDGLQYINWTRDLFMQARDAGVSTIHVTIAYWENTQETLENISQWHQWFQQHDDLILHVRSAKDVEHAVQTQRVGIVFGLQNCSPIEDSLGKIQILHELGVRFMQLSYNNQSLLATGCYEKDDPGITRFGKEAIREMNRVGMVIDMSHSSERSTLEAIELSDRPIAITHANPSFFHAALRNKSDAVIRALGDSGGILGCSIYPFHLNNGSNCTLNEFCQMIAKTVEMIGIDHVAIGSDLCQNWQYDTLEWMRSGRWSSKADYGEGSADNKDWPKQPEWFKSNRDFANIADGLLANGFEDAELRKILGQNWLSFFAHSFCGQ